MPPATEAAIVFAQIHRLFHELRGVPPRHVFHDGRRAANPAYTALETQIRALSDRYAVLKTQEPRS